MTIVITPEAMVDRILPLLNTLRQLLKIIYGWCIGYCKVYSQFRSCFRIFGAKVLGIFILMEQQFHRNESSWNICS